MLAEAGYGRPHHRATASDEPMTSDLMDDIQEAEATYTAGPGQRNSPIENIHGGAAPLIPASPMQQAASTDPTRAAASATPAFSPAHMRPIALETASIGSGSAGADSMNVTVHSNGGHPGTSSMATATATIAAGSAQGSDSPAVTVTVTAPLFGTHAPAQTTPSGHSTTSITAASISESQQATAAALTAVAAEAVSSIYEAVHPTAGRHN